MTEYISYNRKKGASIYKSYWVQLKENPNKLITYPIESRKQTRFLRMVQKLKWLDKNYKQQHPHAKLVSYKYPDHLKIMLVVSQQLSLF